MLGVLVLLLAAGHGSASPHALRAGEPPVVVLSRAVLASFNARFAEGNAHWDELGDLNTLERLLGTVRPTPIEFLGCVTGRAGPDTVHVTGWSEARGLKRLPGAAAGTCNHVPGLVGTWHTHPWRADERRLPAKDRRLSARDLATFTEGRDAVVLAVWDVDSVDAAVRDAGVRSTIPPACSCASPSPTGW
jgi:hypothetical protein